MVIGNIDVIIDISDIVIDLYKKAIGDNGGIIHSEGRDEDTFFCEVEFEGEIEELSLPLRKGIDLSVINSVVPVLPKE